MWFHGLCLEYLVKQRQFEATNKGNGFDRPCMLFIFLSNKFVWLKGESDAICDMWLGVCITDASSLTRGHENHFCLLLSLFVV